MKLDEFEQKLSRQPLRQVPSEWRAEILAVANTSARPAVNIARPGLLSALSSQLSTLFWPYPKAWAGLAAVWLFIFAVNYSMRDPSPQTAEKSAPPSPETIVELKKQQRMFAELVGSREPLDAERQKFFSPKPRSERVEILTT